MIINHAIRRVTRHVNKTSSFFFAKADWVSSAARLVDIGGTYPSYRLRQLTKPTVAEAIASDWQRVGCDLYKAMHQVDKDLSDVDGR